MECDEHKNSLCRVCLKCDPSIQQSGASIFDKTEDVFIYERLNTICDVDIKPEDGLPDRICVECLLELHNAVRFKRKCESSNILLQSAVNTNTKSAVKKEAIEDIILEKNHYTDHEFFNEDYDELEIGEPHSPPPDHVKHEYNQIQREEGTNAERTQDFELKEQHYRQDVKLKEDHYTNQEYLNDDKDEEELYSPNDYVKHEHGALQQEEEIQPNTERLSKAIDLKLECHDCGGLFRTKCKLKVHWKKEHLKQYLTCKCMKVFSTFKAFHNHKRKDSQICSSIEIMFHIEGTGRSIKFFCKQCYYSTSSRVAVKHHVRKHNGEKRFQCEICSKRFFSIGLFYNHKEQHHQIYRREGPCDICGEYIKGLQRLRLHMRKHKKKDNIEVSCDICNKVYKNKNGLIVHMEIHTGKTYPCDLCSRTFNSRSNYYVHKKRLHRGIRSYEMCPICGFSTNRCAMKSHTAKHNAGKCACIVCGKFFDNDLQLKLHKQRHDERNNKCTLCDRTYYSRPSLLKHLNKVHKSFVHPKTNTDVKIRKNRISSSKVIH